MIKCRKRGEAMGGARIRIGDQPKGESELDGLPDNTVIGKAVGVGNKMASVIGREALMRMHLRLVTEAVERELGGWELDAVVDVVVYVIEHGMGAALVRGELALEDVLDLMDDKEMDTRKAS